MDLNYGDYTDFILVLPGSNKAKIAIQVGAFLIGAIGVENGSSVFGGSAKR